MPADKTAAPAAGERIAKVLSRAGVASRREAERMIETGQVSVNGKVIDSPALNVTARDRITVNGQPLAPPEPARLWLYYKPEGLVTSASDEKGRDTVFDHLPEDLPRVMTVGRLDLNSEGLLLLTNDGELKRRLELPSTGWLRKYRVRVNGTPTDPDFDPLRRGIEVEGEKFQPMEVKLDRVQGANAWVTVGLREGKNREIRRAMNAIGLYVNRLIRVSYGPFRLNELRPGEVEEVRAKVLRDQLGLEGEAQERAPGKRGPAPRAASTGPAARTTPSRAPTGPARSVTTTARSSGKTEARSRWEEEQPEAAESETRRPGRNPRFKSGGTTGREEGRSDRPMAGKAAAGRTGFGKAAAPKSFASKSGRDRAERDGFGSDSAPRGRPDRTGATGEGRSFGTARTFSSKAGDSKPGAAKSAGFKSAGAKPAGRAAGTDRTADRGFDRGGEKAYGKGPASDRGPRGSGRAPSSSAGKPASGPDRRGGKPGAPPRRPRG